MKSYSAQTKLADFEAKLAECAAIEPNIVLYFAPSASFKDEKLLSTIKQKLGGSTVIACSTSGEIGSKGVMDNTISLLGLHFDKATVASASSAVTSPAQSFDAGRDIAQQLNKQPGLKAIFTLAPGLNINGSQFVQGLRSEVGDNVVITGGLAGDGTDFKQTYTLLNGEVHGDRAVAFGVYGDDVRVSTGSKGGWMPFGPARRVTRVENNVLYELDGSPALELYKQYLGDKAEQLPSSGLLYPLAILHDDKSTSGLIRTILDVDHEKGSLILAGDLREGSLVCLMHADTELLVSGAKNAALESLGSDATDEGAAILVSCVGRKLVMADDVDEEVDAVRDALGEQVAIAGFYSYGEICPFAETSVLELHNQTMTITRIYEKAA